MSLYEKALIELTKVAREAFGQDEWEMRKEWMDEVVPAYGVTPRQYIEEHGDAGIASLSNHIRGIAAGVHA